MTLFFFCTLKGGKVHKKIGAIVYLLSIIIINPTVYFGTTPHPVTVTTRIIPFLVGNPYKPSFVTVTGWGVDRMYTLYVWWIMAFHDSIFLISTYRPKGSSILLWMPSVSNAPWSALWEMGLGFPRLRNRRCGKECIFFLKVVQWWKHTRTHEKLFFWFLNEIFDDHIWMTLRLLSI